MKIYSEPGEGTTVRIYLPRLRADVPRTSELPTPRPVVRGGGSETILVVEDDDDVRSTRTNC